MFCILVYKTIAQQTGNMIYAEEASNSNKMNCLISTMKNTGGQIFYNEYCGRATKIFIHNEEHGQATAALLTVPTRNVPYGLYIIPR